MRTDLIPLAQARRSHWSYPMNHSTRLLSILALSFCMPLAYAHDPKEHAKEAAAAKAAPDCAAMKDMDHSKTDPNDPVMKAMMAKCGGASGHADGDHPQANKPATPAKPHNDGHGDH